MFDYNSSAKRKPPSLQPAPLPYTSFPLFSATIQDSPISASTLSSRRPDIKSHDGIRPSNQAHPSGAFKRPNSPSKPTPSSSTEPMVTAKDFAESQQFKESQQDGAHEYTTSYQAINDQPSDGDSRFMESFLPLPNNTSRSTIDILPRPDGQSAAKDKLNVPPAGIHDRYVSRFFDPIDVLDSMSETGKPTLHRSTLPSTLPSHTKKETATKEEHHQPIFEIFNAELSKEGDSMSKTLRNLLGAVLKGQEEIGKMHLNLEGLRGVNDTYEQVNDWKKEDGKDTDNKDLEQKLERREKGVDEIMQKLDSLSQSLRSYHDLGTPKISFHHSHLPAHPQDSKLRNESTGTVDPSFDTTKRSLHHSFKEQAQPSSVTKHPLSADTGGNFPVPTEKSAVDVSPDANYPCQSNASLEKSRQPSPNEGTDS
ncbi:hypothetical protein L204_100323 [Cryptococcus depauperatus]|nr:hypothetical protein L204_02194 [Cryptococcus depauperatus CBS 7855]